MKRPMLCPRISGTYFHESAMPPEIFQGRIFEMPPNFGHSFVNELCPQICDSMIYFIHWVAIHNTTKLLPLTSQTKLTPTITLTLTNTVTVILFTCILLTPIKWLYYINKRSFCGGAQQGSWEGHFLAVPSKCTTCLLHQRQEVDSSYFIIKRRFFWRNM